jgi:hypothetical protein
MLGTTGAANQQQQQTGAVVCNGVLRMVWRRWNFILNVE